MAATVWKFPWPKHPASDALLDANAISAPKGTRFIKLAWQHQTVAIWGVVPDQKAPMETRMVYMIGTGHNMPEAADPDKYIGTVMLNYDNLVLHFFEGK